MSLYDDHVLCTVHRTCCREDPCEVCTLWSEERWDKAAFSSYAAKKARRVSRDASEAGSHKRHHSASSDDSRARGSQEAGRSRPPRARPAPAPTNDRDSRPFRPLSASRTIDSRRLSASRIPIPGRPRLWPTPGHQESFPADVSRQCFPARPLRIRLRPSTQLSRRCSGPTEELTQASLYPRVEDVPQLCKSHSRDVSGPSPPMLNGAVFLP